MKVFPGNLSRGPATILTSARTSAFVNCGPTASTQVVVFCLVFAQHVTECPGGRGKDNNKVAPKRIASNAAYLLLEKADQYTNEASHFPLWDKVRRDKVRSCMYSHACKTVKHVI